MYLLKKYILFKERSLTEADSYVVLISGFPINSVILEVLQI